MDKDRIKLDRMRYVKDNMPSNFAILAIVFDVLYFVLIYKINNEFFYNFLIGVSIIVNLLFMLFGIFLSTRTVKRMARAQSMPPARR